MSAPGHRRGRSAQVRQDLPVLRAGRHGRGFLWGALRMGGFGAGWSPHYQWAGRPLQAAPGAPRPLLDGGRLAWS